jgi:hypothetical protein
MIISLTGSVSYWWLSRRRGHDLPPAIEPVRGSES